MDVRKREREREKIVDLQCEHCVLENYLFGGRECQGRFKVK